jgi:Protein of unknown function (DUF559)
MTLALRRPDALAWQVFRGTDAIREGLVTPNGLRSRSWQRLRQDVYADSRLERDHALACSAAALTLPDEAVIAGRSAAYRHGVDHAAGYADPVHIVVAPTSSFRVRTGLVVHRATLHPDEVERVGPDRCTSPVRTAWDVALWHDLPVAVGIIDALLAAGRMGPGQLMAFCEQRTGQRGHLQARRAFTLADGRSQSPPESRLRVRLAEAGLPPATPQCPVTAALGVPLYLDLGWSEYRVGLEYDGHWHATAEQLHRDRRRLNLLQGAGWIVLHATSDRLRRDFTGLLTEIRAALTSRGWRPA